MNTFGRPLDATLVDALSRGALTFTDLGGLTGRELNALYLSGQRALANEHTQQAVLLFSLATELMPYQARFWRALGVSLHRLGDFAKANVAYRAALYLFPDHPQIEMYLAETTRRLQKAQTIQGTSNVSLAPLSETPQQRGEVSDKVAHPRATSGDILEKKAASIGPVLDALMSAEELTLTDGRVLPLDRFDQDAVSFAIDASDINETPLSPKERTALTTLALGEQSDADGGSGAPSEGAKPPDVRGASDGVKANMPPSARERTLAFRLRLSAVSLDDEVTQTQTEPERTLTQTRSLNEL